MWRQHHPYYIFTVEQLKGLLVGQWLPKNTINMQ